MIDNLRQNFIELTILNNYMKNRLEDVWNAPQIYAIPWILEVSGVGWGILFYQDFA